MPTLYTLILLVAGLTTGVILNALADRLPLVGLPGPVPSRLGRRWRPFLVVAANTALYLYLGTGFSANGRTAGEVALTALYSSLWLLILVIDLEHRRVLNVVVAPALVVGLMAALFHSPATLLNAVLAGCLGFGSFLVLAMMRPGAMGAGDVKLVGLMGVLLGLPYVFVALLVGAVAGGIGSALLLATRKVGLQSKIPYAPYLAVGAWVAMVFGTRILAWYGPTIGW